MNKNIIFLTINLILAIILVVLYSIEGNMGATLGWLFGCIYVVRCILNELVK